MNNSSITCPFCSLILKKNSNGRIFYPNGLYQYIIKETDNFLLISDLSPIVAGHMLIITKNHFPNIKQAQISLPCLNDEIDALLNFSQRIYANINSQSVVTFEHGSPIRGSSLEESSSCIDHAHLHVLPLPNSADLQVLVSEILNTNKIEMKHDYHSGYLKFSFHENTFLLQDNYIRQYFRIEYSKFVGKKSRGLRQHCHNTELISETNDLINRLKLAVSDIPTLITIDGLLFTGKSTVSDYIIDKYKYSKLNTGLYFYNLAKYTLNIKEADINLKIEDKTLKLFSQGGTMFILIDDKIYPFINQIEEKSIIARVARSKIVREHIYDFLRKASRNNYTVVDGRDTGVNLFPYAKIKFYMEADLSTRINRMKSAYNDMDIDKFYHREAFDRTVSKKTADAITIQNDSLSLSELKLIVDKHIKRILL